MKINEKLFMTIRYIFIAGLVYLIDMGMYVVFLYLGLVPVTANIAAKILATIFGFFGHRFFTYQIKDNKDILKHALRFFALFVFYIPVSSILLVIAIKIIGDPVIAKFICDIILVAMTFWLNSKFTFLQENNKKSELDS